MTSVPLPEPADGRANPSDRIAMSRRFLAQVRSELEEGDRTQASEKIWGAAAQAVKAIGHERGWNYDGHGIMFAVVAQLAKEFEDASLLTDFNTANSMHVNFYDNDQDSYGIQVAAAQIEVFLDRLDVLRQEPPRPFVINTENDQLLIQRLTDRRHSIGASSGIGFTRPGHWETGGESPAASSPA